MREIEDDEDERDEVFAVEVSRGPHGLGLALVDGLVRKTFKSIVICFY